MDLDSELGGTLFERWLWMAGDLIAFQSQLQSHIIKVNVENAK